MSCKLDQSVGLMKIALVDLLYWLHEPRST